MSLPEYTFVPWLRQGLAAEISDADRLGLTPETGATGRPTLDVELTLDVVAAPGAPTPPRPTIARTVQILGPGDVQAVKREAILRTQPADGTLGATPDELAFVEFYDEDLPWRYTPARAASSKLRPWIALLVLTEEEFTLQDKGDRALSVLTFTPKAQLPPVDETWAWAHAQLSQIVATAAAVGPAIAADPDHARSRLLSPRRLTGGTQFHAFLVPAFEAGRLAGLDRAVDGVPSQKPSWGLALHATDRDMPVYHRFSFRTSTVGDFETLARRLVPRPVGPEFGSRPLDVSDPGFGLDTGAGATVALEGALGPPAFAPAPFAVPWDATATDLQPIVDAGTAAMTPAPVGTLPPDPIVVPPAYGRRHVGLPRVVDARNQTDLAWLTELNLDLRSRAAAGLGTEVVRARQDELMQRAWEQVARVEAANQRLREAELARAAADALLRKHIEPLAGDDRLTLLTAPAHAGLPVPPTLPLVVGTPGHPGVVAETATVRAAVDASRVPAAAQSPAFRRLTRAQRPLMRRLGTAGQAQAFQQDLLGRMDATTAPLTAATFPLPDPDAAVSLATIQGAAQTSVNDLAAKPPRPFQVFLPLADAVVAARPAGAPIAPGDPATLITALEAAIRAHYPGVPFTAAQPGPDTEARHVWTLAHAVTAVTADGPGRARLSISEPVFIEEFSDDALGKAHGRVTVVRAGGAPAGATIGRTTSLQDAQAFVGDLGAFGSGLATRPDRVVAPALAATTVRDHVLGALAPALTLGARLAKTIVIDGPLRTRLLDPVQAAPTFPDPMFEPLCALSQDHIIPNLNGLQRESLTIMEPNRRFIEAYLAGANTAFNQELLWREYPTDQRGTAFRTFWDGRDAPAGHDRQDITAIDRWSGALGGQAPTPAAVLVLVVRGELLERFPTTVIYAQRAAFPGGDPMAPRILDPTVPVRDPIFSGTLDPDVRLVGFPLGVEEARGRRVTNAHGPVDPGWFFVFMERPGEPRFGLDSAEVPPPLDTWDALAWSSLSGPADSPFVHLAANAALAPTGAVTAQWGRTAADQASILLQSPVLLARHASEMLP